MKNLVKLIIEEKNVSESDAKVLLEEVKIKLNDYDKIFTGDMSGKSGECFVETAKIMSEHFGSKVTISEVIKSI